MTTVAEPRVRKSSLLWYFLPVFFQVIGGLAVCFTLRRRDRKMARNTLLVGIALSVVTIVVVVFLYGTFRADMAHIHDRMTEGGRIVNTA